MRPRPAQHAGNGLTWCIATSAAHSLPGDTSMPSCVSPSCSRIIGRPRGVAESGAAPDEGAASAAISAAVSSDG